MAKQIPRMRVPGDDEEVPAGGVEGEQSASEPEEVEGEAEQPDVPAADRPRMLKVDSEVPLQPLPDPRAGVWPYAEAMRRRALPREHPDYLAPPIFTDRGFLVDTLA